MNIELTGDWDRLGDILATKPAAIRKAMAAASLETAKAFRDDVRTGIDTQNPGGGGFVPLSRETLIRRARDGVPGSDALLAWLDLYESISVVAKSDEAFAGIPRRARNREGKSLVMIGSVHENGAVIIQRNPVTSAEGRQRRIDAYLAAGGTGSVRQALQGYRVIHIPARPFLEPILRQYLADPEELGQRYIEHVAAALGVTP